MSHNYDIIIIGAGHNGLVCATQLSQKGKKVLVLEANNQVGGLASTCEFTPNFKISSVAHLLYGLHPKVYEKCNLASHGPKFSNQNMATIVTNGKKEYVRFTSGSLPDLSGDATIDQEQKSHWHIFHDEMKKYSEILYTIAHRLPPRLKHRGLQDYKTLLSIGLKLNRLKKHELRQFLRIVGMNIYDLVEESFNSNLLKAAVSYEAILGSRLGPRAPNTVYNWLNRRSIADQNKEGLLMPCGGMGAISDALQRAAEKNGAEIKTNCKVSKITISANQVNGVVLESGESYKAGKVISNTDIKKTMLSLVGAANIDTDIVRRVNWIPMQGTTAKLHLALKQLPTSITGSDSDFSARIIYAPDPNTIERASNAIKYNEYADEPVFEVTVPSVNDDTLAPQGKHVMSVLVPYVPYSHKNSWQQEHDKFESHIIDKLEHLLPGLKNSVEFVETLTPYDIEQQFNVTGGHWHHGEIGLERFLVSRPIPGYAQYQTSVSGLYLCGAGCHPGGDVTGTAGLNAATAVLKESA